MAFPATRRKRLLFYWILFTLQLVFICLVLEFGIRAMIDRGTRVVPIFQTTSFHPFYRVSENSRLLYEMNPRVVMPEDEKAQIPTNRSGFRDFDYGFQKDAKTFRILGLGDSIAYGMDIPFHHRYLKILEKKLNQNHSGKNFEVINAGVCGYNLTQYYHLLRDRGLAYQPDLVLISLWDDDISPPYIPAFNRDITDPIFKLHATLIDHSKLYGFLFYRFVVSSYYSEAPDGYEKDEHYRSFEELLKLHTTGKTRVVFLYHPELRDQGDPPDLAHLQPRMDQAGIRWINLESAYITALGKRSLSSLSLDPGLDPAHINIEGNQIAAKALYDFLKKEKLIK
jgi:lysophospholipase L1-like esterase